MRKTLLKIENLHASASIMADLLRVKCAVLAWHTVQEAIEKKAGG